VAVSNDTIEKIKALPLSSVLEAEGVFLRRVGREFVTHCLWHKDKNPSLTISDDKGFVFCHVCQAHNDSIGFIQQKYGINFRDACERIASKHNLNCVYVDESSEEYEKKRIQVDAQYKKTTDEQKYYRSSLKTHNGCIKFIQSRNIRPDTSREFELGFDPRENRLTIPIHAYNGKLVGFTARAINNDIKPKYKNTENNLIFNKSEIVYNEYRASSYIRENDECIFVEGHIDVIALWQNDIKNAVALQGTASPSTSIINRLITKTKRFVLCMDGDAGGKAAIAKFLDTVQSFTLDGRLDVRIALLPDGQDPDSFISSGGNLKSLIANAPSWMDWLLDSWLADIDFHDKLKIQEIENLIKELFSKISSPALRAHYFDKASVALAQNKQGLAAEISKGFHDHKPTDRHFLHWSKPDLLNTRKIVEKKLVRLYIHKVDYRFVLRPLMDNLFTPHFIWLWQRIKEIEEITNAENLKDCLAAILCVSDINHVQHLRSTIAPTISLFDDELSIIHIEDIMISKLEIEGTIE